MGAVQRRSWPPRWAGRQGVSAMRSVAVGCGSSRRAVSRPSAMPVRSACQPRRTGLGALEPAERAVTGMRVPVTSWSSVSRESEVRVSWR